ncbi:MAG: TetR/AcrR family transcriptional regulator [Desulfobacteraceae bacterium]|jgi:AcrR family transcriptional regulator
MVISIDRKERTKSQLVGAVGKVLMEHGFKEFGVNKVAQAAGVDKALIYRYFGGLPELVSTYSQTVDFWPSVQELLGPSPQSLAQATPEEQIAVFFKNFLAALRKRPITQEILAWELLEKNEFSSQLENIRIRTVLEYFDFCENIPDEDFLPALIVLMSGAINYVIVKSRISSTIGGIDLETEEGWEKINNGIDILLKNIFTSSCKRPSKAIEQPSNDQGASTHDL